MQELLHFKVVSDLLAMVSSIFKSLISVTHLGTPDLRQLFRLPDSGRKAGGL